MSVCYTTLCVPQSSSGSPPARTQGHSLPFTNGSGAWRDESPVHSGSADGGHPGWNLDAPGLTPGVRPPCPLPSPHRIQAFPTPPGLQALQKAGVAWGTVSPGHGLIGYRSSGAQCCHPAWPRGPCDSADTHGTVSGRVLPRAGARLVICVPSTQACSPRPASNYVQSAEIGPITDRLRDRF